MEINKERLSYDERKQHYKKELRDLINDELRKLKKRTRKCPKCKEEILNEAIICKHCRSEVEPNLKLRPFHEGYIKISLQKKYFTKEEIDRDNKKSLGIFILIIMLIMGFIMYSCGSEKTSESEKKSSYSNSSPSDSRFNNREAEKNYNKFLDNQKNFDGSKFDTKPLRGY